MTTQAFDVLIIGAGVTGSALARHLVIHTSLSVGVLEKEDRPARHTSGRNSGVLHSGFNPKPGTLKATLCVEGNKRAREFCRTKGVACQDVGTVVTALTEADESVLEELLKRGQASGVPGIRILTQKELNDVEPHAAGRSALHAPSGAIVDNAGFVQAVAAEAEEKGAHFFFNRRVRSIEDTGSGVKVTCRGGEVFQAQKLVNCAGLYADTIAHLMGVGLDKTIVPFRGQYWKLTSRKSDWVRSMIYPAPDLRYPFLGVHWTRTVRGDVLAGPNAVLAFGRESYEFFSLHPAEFWKMMIHPSVWKMVFSKEFSKMPYDQLWISIIRRKFAEEGAKVLPGVEPADMEPYSRAGNRPQLINKEGELIEDLVIEKGPRSMHVLNAVSPGFTCSLAFAEHLAKEITYQA